MYYALANGIAPFVLHSDRSNLKEILEDMRFGRLPMTYRAPNGKAHTFYFNQWSTNRISLAKRTGGLVKYLA